MSRLEDMHAAILATAPGRPGPTVSMGFMSELIERVWQLEQQVADLSELARTANQVRR